MLQQFKRALIVGNELCRGINIVNILIHQYMKVKVSLKNVFFYYHLALFFLTGMMHVVVVFDSIDVVMLEPNLLLCFPECCDCLGWTLRAWIFPLSSLNSSIFLTPCTSRIAFHSSLQ